ncbi:MAG TPA: protein-L-isoaspartate(D-aspartate) O-methyltransferase, partial [Chloroflexota bacterium]|nr:protein-L-isoaspartate(D-aspartate) O-methyltransferase [Chloroflexota bacterium]
KASGEDVLRAIARVPRDVFVPEKYRHRAFDDEALPLDCGQTISQPTVVAMMTAALKVTPELRVLEIGTGSGYQAAVLAELVAEVVSVERIPALADHARRLLDYLGYRNASVVEADGTLGWPELAPYDRILVTAASPTVPLDLLDQLVPDGLLVLPVGGREDQQLVVVTRDASGHISERSLGLVRFVPLIGENGWDR